MLHLGNMNGIKQFEVIENDLPACRAGHLAHLPNKEKR